MDRKAFSRQLRKQMTPEEKILWEQVRNRKLKGYKFRRQHPINDFIVDFVCLEKKLVVELDGSVHNEVEQAKYDKGRDEILEELGYEVMRFYNSAVTNDLNVVLDRIAAVLEDRR